MDAMSTELDRLSGFAFTMGKVMGYLNSPDIKAKIIEHGGTEAEIKECLDKLWDLWGKYAR